MNKINQLLHKFPQLKYYIKNAYLEIRRRFFYFLLSFLSVTILVTSTCISQSIIDRAPVIFQNSAETNVGKFDIKINPSQNDVNQGDYFGIISYLNTTRIKETINLDEIEQVYPSFSITGDLVADTPKTQCKIDINNKYEMFLQANQCSFKRKAIFHFFEEEYLNEQEVIIHQKMASQLGVNLNDKVYFRTIIFTNLFSNLLEKMCEQKKREQKIENINLDQICWNYKHKIIYQTSLNTFILPFKIVKIVDQFDGKLYPISNKEENMIANYKYILKYMIDFYNPSSYMFFDNKQNILFSYINENLGKYEEFSTEIFFKLKNRNEIYIDSNYDNIQEKVVKVASNMVKDLGVFPVQMKMPILEEISSTSQSQMFLGIILNLIIFILFLLSVFLLYNLLIVSVDTKIFQIGVLRVLGLGKLGVVGLIIVQALSYVLPAIIFGFILGIILLQIVNSQLYQQFTVEMPTLPSQNAFLISFFLGFIIPLISSIFPIKQALSRTLNVALDSQRCKTQAVKITIDIEGKGFPWGLISYSLISGMFGICMCFLLPLALLSQNTGLLIAIFFMILVGLLVGFVIMAMNIQYLTEKFVVFVCFFWVKKVLRNVVIKNLAAHRIRNRRTSIMYSISISFLIFVWSSMQIQIDASDFQEKRIRGVSLEVYAKDNNSFKMAQFEKIINSKLSNQIEEYSWVTSPLDDIVKQQGYITNYITHIGRIYQYNPLIVGVSPNYLKTVYTEEFLDIYTRTNSELDIVEELYTPRGSQSVIMGKAYADSLKIGQQYNDTFLNVIYNNTYSKTYELRVSSIINQMPGMTLSLIQDGEKPQNIIVSLLTYMKFAGIEDVDDIPMKNLKLKVKQENVNFVYDQLNNLISGDQKFSEILEIYDYRDSEITIQSQKNLINLIFSVVCIIVMLVCFFSLVSVMTANIYEQTKEIAVLRLIGLNCIKIKCIYIIESFTVVFSSCLLGTIIGLIIGFTINVQRNIFTELPINFPFPYTVFITVCITSLFCAFFSTWLPSKRILNNQISLIMRMNE